MIESGMYFVLGLATAGLLALMIAPILWRRAVRLTRARIEHAVPANLAVIQADKDQLRAEFAMSARRLESTIEKLRQKAGSQLVEIDEKRDLIGRLAAEQSRRVEALDQLQERESELHALLRRREDRMSETTAEMATLRNNLAERSRALEQLEQTLSRYNESKEEQTVELVAKGTEIGNLRDNLAAAKSRQTSLQIERTRLETELAEALSAKTVAEEKVNSLDRRFAMMAEEHGARLAYIDERNRQIDRLRREVDDKDRSYAELGRQLVEAEAANIEASAKISQLTLDLDQMSRREPTEELRTVLVQLETERDVLASELAAAQEAYARTQTENAELQRISGDDWEAERIQNAMLRERLNDIAGEVSRLTRSYQDDIGPSELAALARVESAAEPRRGPRANQPRPAHKDLHRTAQRG